MSSSNVDPVVALNAIVTQMNRYFSTIIYIFGNVGNILNILVLSQRSLRSNPCAMFFMGSSVAGLITLVSGLSPRVLSAWTADLSETIRWICKLRGFALFTSRATAFWLVMLATIDRWLLSCPDARRRHLSTTKNAQRGMIIVIIVSIIIHCQLFYCYEANLVNAPGKCFSNGLMCRLWSDMLFAVWAILIPLSMMTIFGLLTIINVRRARNRIHVVNVSTVCQQKTSNIGQGRTNKTNHRLLIMLFVQVVLLAFLTIPASIEKFYSTLTSTYDKSRIQVAIENIIYNGTLLLTYSANGMQFYIYTLSGGKLFRKAFFDLIRSVGHKLIRR